MITSCQTGMTNVANSLALLYLNPRPHAFGHFYHMQVLCRIYRVMLDFNIIAIVLAVTGLSYHAVADAADRCSLWCCKISTLMRLITFLYRVESSS